MTVTTEPDPTLRRLLPPTRSTKHRVVTAVLAIAALAGVGFASFGIRLILYPLATEPEYSVSSATVPRDDGTFGEITSLTFRALPGTQLVSVGPVPGLEVVGAWIRPAGDWPQIGTAEDGLKPLYDRTSTELPPTALPATISSGRYTIVIAWRVTDCAKVPAGAAAPSLTFRTVLGTTRTQEPGIGTVGVASSLHELSPRQGADLYCERTEPSE